ncbi:aspartyl/asparaginyl beta-hydroxylase domain-containing protein [Sphingomonas sp. CFBP 8760]|uniref:aspartyl/asparaginyl beta-hydroxylase domain-containing protein n=1 Tax=Sphingomonas sp. CFBP 8760 TaxID=2775282 RepID=UPI001784EBA6|nr:aspartyl/asparaginyl beta-hydroxylase domain-containing protein [Sphingomonas sp. CFBP 8760]MBD8546137.1 aspartyl/asparaginyl beta-hydroxylase domain-containing protein [Sphingomonas sp. CFBP 8760]
MSDASRLQTIITQAVAARQRGDASGERRLLDDGLAIAPGHPQLLNAAGMRAMADGDLSLALARFAAAAAHDPDQPVLWINQATIHRQLGDDGAEQRALDRALAIDRLNFTAQLRMTELHERRGRAAEAAQGWAGIVQMAAAMPQRTPPVEDALARGRAFLSRHTGDLGHRIDDALGGRASRRMAACVDHMLGRRAIYANQCDGIHFPFLPADEFFDRALFPWFAELEARTPAIRAEALALMKDGGAGIRPYVRQEAGTPDNKWSGLDNNPDWSACFLYEYGVRNDEVCARCPETAAALAAAPQTDIPGKAPSAFFSILSPHAHIPAHTGVTNTRTIVHLPLVVPDKCRFRVGGETRAWREGEAFAFDDTIEHEAWNDSDEARIVLILDVWNPHLTADERMMLQQVYAITGQQMVGG